jgi:1,2-diacylglycerol-3-alpha-glucose alpha-1,2-glucosyltransferase
MPHLLPSVWRARKAGVRVVVHARHLPELVIGGFRAGRLIYPVFHRYSRYLYNMADAVVCATPYVKRWMQQNGITTPLYVIPNGVDCRMFRPSASMRATFRERYGMADDRRVVLSVGLLIPRKGVADFTTVARKCPEMTFAWIGASEAGLQAAVADFPDNVLHIPYLPFEEMPAAYNGADLFFFPTHAESYGNVLMEAAACGTAIVLRDIEIYDAWFTHGKDCLKGTTADEFVAAVWQLSSDDRLRETIAAGALETARRHDLERTIDALKAMYEDILNS